MKSKKLQVFGAWIEVVSLVALFFGAFWQARMSGWWDQQLPEWQAFVQEEVNLTVLSSLKNIASMEDLNDPYLKKATIEDIRTRIDRTIEKTISEREQRTKETTSGQAAAFWFVRDFFMISGAFLLVAGKIVSLYGMKLEP